MAHSFNLMSPCLSCSVSICMIHSMTLSRNTCHRIRMYSFMMKPSLAIISRFSSICNETSYHTCTTYIIVSHNSNQCPHRRVDDSNAALSWHIAYTSKNRCSQKYRSKTNFYSVLFDLSKHQPDDEENHQGDNHPEPSHGQSNPR